ncbi:MAG: hypothetical protein ACE5G2_02045 [Candidatus Krumholzibacteriia bacterium]
MRLRRRARIVDGSDVLSEILDHPGPTDTLFDVLAACMAALSPGPSVAMLGFAGGGVVAPLRAMGFSPRLEAVDISRQGEALFRELCGTWAGQIDVTQADAAAWLRHRKKRYHLILEDLSTSGDAVSVKPDISLETLPRLIRRRLTPDGVAVTNLIPVPGMSWTPLLERMASPFASAHVVHVSEYVNKILIAGDALGSARDVSRRVRESLYRIGSFQATGISIRSLRP